MGWGVLLSLLIIAIGVFLFFKPEVYWKIAERWKSYRADEPSELYRICTKCGGVAFMLAGVVILVLIAIQPLLER